MQISITNYFEYFPAGPHELAWNFHVSALGHARVSPGSVYPPDRHPAGHDFTWERGRALASFQLVAIAEGRGVLETRTERRDLGAGAVFFLLPGVWHRYRPEKLTGWTEQWFELRGATLEAWLASGALETGPVNMASQALFWREFETLHGICHDRDPGFRAVAAGLAATLVAMTLSAKAGAGDAGGAGGAELVRSAREGLNAGQSISETTRRLGVSYPTFYRKFKQSTGLSPKEYSREIRLARAEELLTGSGLSIKEIASRLGYHSASHFSLEFKKLRGRAPTHYRGESCSSSVSG